jgi:hypothetical protein
MQSDSISENLLGKLYGYVDTAQIRDLVDSQKGKELRNMAYCMADAVARYEYGLANPEAVHEGLTTSQYARVLEDWFLYNMYR